MVTMKVMNLRSQETITGRKPFIVIGTLTAHGEELSSRGKVVKMFSQVHNLLALSDSHL